MVTFTPLLFLVGFIAAAAAATTVTTLFVMAMFRPRTRGARLGCYLASLSGAFGVGVWFICVTPYFRFSPSAPLITVLFWLGIAELATGVLVGVLVAPWIWRRISPRTDPPPTI